MKPNISLGPNRNIISIQSFSAILPFYFISPCLMPSSRCNKSSIDLAAVNLCEIQLWKIRSGHIQRWQQQGLGEKASWSKNPAKMGIQI
jgi:hypothetical protein